MAASRFWFSSFGFFLAGMEGRLPSSFRAGPELVLVVSWWVWEASGTSECGRYSVMTNEITQRQRGLCSTKTSIGGRERDARRESKKKPERQENQKNETSRSPRGEGSRRGTRHKCVNPAERSDTLGAENCPSEGAVWQFGWSRVQRGKGVTQIRKKGHGGGEVVVVAVAGDFFSKKFVGNGFDGALFPPGGKT